MQDQQPDTRALLARMAAAYATVSTYADRGSVHTTFTGPDHTHSNVRPFFTAFDRAAIRFRFEFTKQFHGDAPVHRYIVWRDGQDVRTWWDVRPGVCQKHSLDMALAGATGVSGGAAHTMPVLLMPDEITGSTLADLPSAALKDDQMLDGSPCHVVSGLMPMPDGDDEHVTLFIDAKTLLIRRIIERGPQGDIEVESVTTYYPVADGPLPEEAFAFDAPE